MNKNRVLKTLSLCREYLKDLNEFSIREGVYKQQLLEIQKGINSNNSKEYNKSLSKKGENVSLELIILKDDLLNLKNKVSKSLEKIGIKDFFDKLSIPANIITYCIFNNIPPVELNILKEIKKSYIQELKFEDPEELNIFKEENPTLKECDFEISNLMNSLEQWNKEYSENEESKEKINKMVKSKTLPPVIIERYTLDGGFKVIDGWHRLAATNKKGEKIIKAFVKDRVVSNC